MDSELSTHPSDTLPPQNIFSPKLGEINAKISMVKKGYILKAPIQRSDRFID
jgi:hypothetical protein